MRIEEEIFREFFKELSENDKFPKSILKDLKHRYKEKNLNTKNNILKAIKSDDLDED